ncbi:stage II sporulation protein D [Clostridium fermenticellae]|uniref:Stage II sporulation protein D n=2 Tax=Clostridium fermenticellae TaxID=2068654 RepID=A0A386H764_9CLOT|nr:stage II sporulation protein D [Clostridium fermenticellae]
MMIVACVILTLVGSFIILDFSSASTDIAKSVPDFFIKSKDIIFNNNQSYKINVYMEKQKKIQAMDLEEYVTGVVCAEVPANFNVEALKAQAVAARTFGAAHMESLGGQKYNSNTGADVCDSVKCQVFMTKDDRFKSWPQSKREEYWNKISDAVKDTKGEILTYKGELVMEPYYFSSSSGKTEDAKDVFSKDVPYLKSVSSLGEQNSYKYRTSVILSYYDFVNKINRSHSRSKLSVNNVKNSVFIKNRDESGYVKDINVGSIILKGSQFRSALGLNSANFVIQFEDRYVKIICTGYGHDVGMSQSGANVMAAIGKSYKQILTHYYTGVNINTIQKIKP